MTEQELQVKERKEAQQAGESTKPQRTFVPPVDIYETEEAVTVIAEMPGVAKEKVEIDLHEGVLTIKGWMNTEPADGRRLLLREYEAGNFTRRFTLAETLEQEKITATMVNGILTVKLPKSEPPKPRRIEVKIG